MDVTTLVSHVLFVGIFIGMPLFLVGIPIVGAIQWHFMSSRDRAIYRHLVEIMSHDSEWSRTLGHGGHPW
jgi:hypothetical protein